MASSIRRAKAAAVLDPPRILKDWSAFLSTFFIPAAAVLDPPRILKDHWLIALPRGGVAAAVLDPPRILKGLALVSDKIAHAAAAVLDPPRILKGMWGFVRMASGSCRSRSRSAEDTESCCHGSGCAAVLLCRSRSRSAEDTESAAVARGIFPNFAAAVLDPPRILKEDNFRNLKRCFPMPQPFSIRRGY